jgi:hypothetical protein
VSLATSATAAGPDDDYAHKALMWKGCMLSYSERLASTPETPNDIATAAIVSCRYLRQPLVEEMVRTGLPKPEADRVLDRAEAEFRPNLIGFILNKRYPR